MNIDQNRKPVNADAAKMLSRKEPPARTVEGALQLIASNLAGDVTRQKVEETLARGLEAEYTVRVKKCPSKPGYNVIMTFKARTDGFTAAHFTDLA